MLDGTFDNKNLLYKEGQDLGMNVKLIEEKLDPKSLMKIWYEEGKNYNYHEQTELESNNFTQMIWKNSTNFGIGFFCFPEEEEEKQIDEENKKKDEKEEEKIKNANKSKKKEMKKRKMKKKLLIKQKMGRMKK